MFVNKNSKSIKFTKLKSCLVKVFVYECLKQSKVSRRGVSPKNTQNKPNRNSSGTDESAFTPCHNDWFKTWTCEPIASNTHHLVSTTCFFLLFVAGSVRLKGAGSTWLLRRSSLCITTRNWMVGAAWGAPAAPRKPGVEAARCCWREPHLQLKTLHLLPSMCGTVLFLTHRDKTHLTLGFLHWCRHFCFI